MIRKRERPSEVEQLRQMDRQAASRRLVVRHRQIVRTEELGERLLVPPLPSSGLPTSAVSFITDWVDS
jgi:hypothetical protein